MQIQPYLSYEGRCEEAIEFYKQALGAEVVMLMRMKDNPEPPGEEGCGGNAAPTAEQLAAMADKVLHAELKIAGNSLLMSDGMMQGPASFKGFGLAVSLPDVAGAEKSFKALSDGGQVTMPLARTFWSPSFGMVNDRFGVCWMVMASPAT